MLRNFLCLFMLISLSCPAYSLKWHRGCYQIDQFDPGIQFVKYGEEPAEILEENLPVKLSQLAKFFADDSAKLFFRLSTGVLGKWEGPGKFSIEGFDHIWVEDGVSKESSSELTRTILYFDKGQVFINAEALSKESSILVETPLGKVVTYGGIFSLKLEEFKDSTQRNAIINCYKGSLVYTDKRGFARTLTDGNKMLIILKNDLFKVNVVKMDEIEQRAVGNFNKERANFIDAGAIPKVDWHTQLNSVKSDVLVSENPEVKKYYYFPVIEQIESFNPYKKSYRDD